MSELYIIKCRFQQEAQSKPQTGLAVCASPDDIIFICDVKGVLLKVDDIWSYTLLHYSPWAKIDFED